MNASVNLLIPGVPQGKGRPRFSSKSRTTYTPAKTRAYEDTIGRLAAFAMRGRDMFYGPVHINMRAYMPIPKSWPKAKQELALAGKISPTGKPDLDNILKALADGLQGIVFDDDSAITSAHMTKVYAKEPFVQVEVFSIARRNHGEYCRVPEIQSEPSQCQKQG